MTGWLGCLVWAIIVVAAWLSFGMIGLFVLACLARIQPGPTPPPPPPPLGPLCSDPPCDREDGWICKTHYLTVVLPGIDRAQEWVNSG